MIAFKYLAMVVVFQSLILLSFIVYFLTFGEHEK